MKKSVNCDVWFLKWFIWCHKMFLILPSSVMSRLLSKRWFSSLGQYQDLMIHLCGCVGGWQMFRCGYCMNVDPGGAYGEILIFRIALRIKDNHHILLPIRLDACVSQTFTSTKCEKLPCKDATENKNKEQKRLFTRTWQNSFNFTAEIINIEMFILQMCGLLFTSHNNWLRVYRYLKTTMPGCVKKCLSWTR